MQRKVSDRGGMSGGKVPRAAHDKAPWEKTTDAILMTLHRKGIARIDEHRRAMEELQVSHYEGLEYYQRWVEGIERLIIEKGLVTREELDRATASG